MLYIRRLSGVLVLGVLSVSNSSAWELNSDFEFETRAFYEESLTGANQFGVSIALQPELYHEWNEGRTNFTASPFLRVDSNDSSRTHFDVRQLDWTTVAGDFEIRIGARKVFWGVAETVHLVDVINQVDFVENLDGEDRLGQPMVNVAWIQDFGTFDVFVMPFFRKRTHPSTNGRLGLGANVSDNAVFESSLEEWNIDLAFRYFNSFGPIDVGYFYFYGTDRTPRYVPGSENGSTVLIPTYDLTHQTGIDLQWIISSLALKFEGILKESNPDTYFAGVVGAEYTFSNFTGGGADLGVLSEYVGDTRGTSATNPSNNDLFFGTRLALNDEDDLQFLGGGSIDLNNASTFFNLEASRRLGDQFEIEFETRVFVNIDSSDFLSTFSKESYSQLTLTYSY